METFISEDEIIALLVDLVRIPSVNPPAGRIWGSTAYSMQPI
jgi:acetylornithine deacetylase/succinyl-diaminopimelate desuccinylase-like protein